MKKGFSLFTPLVGTSVMIIAIIVASAMIQNDIRLSRGLSASYEQTNQNIAAKLIKASSEITIMENIEREAEKMMTSRLVYWCRSESVCKNENSLINGLINEYFRGKLKATLTAAGGGIYSGVTSSIETSSSYTPSADKMCTISNAAHCNTYSGGTERFDCCLGVALGNALDTNAGAVDISFPEDYLRIRVISSNLDPSSFSVEFENKQNNLDRITLSILPYEFPYVSKTPVKKYIDTSAEAFSYLVRQEIDPITDQAELEKTCNILMSQSGLRSAMIKTNINFLNPALIIGDVRFRYSIETKWGVSTSSGNEEMTVVYSEVDPVLPMFTAKNCFS